MNEFFQIVESSAVEDTIKARVSFDAEHPLYNGHFPSNPITPGVVQLDVMKVLMTYHLNADLKLEKLNRCKFLAPINPTQVKELIYTIKFSKQEDNSVKAQCSISDSDEKIYLKTNALFQG